jgi:hypothetical protein
MHTVCDVFLHGVQGLEATLCYQCSDERCNLAGKRMVHNLTTICEYQLLAVLFLRLHKSYFSDPLISCWWKSWICSCSFPKIKPFMCLWGGLFSIASHRFDTSRLSSVLLSGGHPDSSKVHCVTNHPYSKRADACSLAQNLACHQG